MKDRVRESDRATLESVLAADLRSMTSESDRIARAYAGSRSLTSSDFHALLHIMVADTAGSPLSAGDLRQRMGLSGAAITYLVERLAGAGHIRRESDPADRRKVIVRYEPAGMELARSYFTPLASQIRTAVAAVPDKDLATAHRVFGALHEAMRAFGEEMARPPAVPRQTPAESSL